MIKILHISDIHYGWKKPEGMGSLVCHRQRKKNSGLCMVM